MREEESRGILYVICSYHHHSFALLNKNYDIMIIIITSNTADLKCTEHQSIDEWS